MKPIYAFIFAALLAVTGGCSKDNVADDMFEGHDNYITSFVLTTREGVRCEAAVTSDRIEITVPETCVLEGATAEYTVCEQALLYPDPAGIADWDDEHRFRVVSHNETVRDYLYTVRRTDVSSSGSVVLLTQSDVEAFAATGISSVDGSLVIGSMADGVDDPVTDLSPLAGLSEVRYDIVINASFKGESLDGLENVVRAGGLIVGTPVAAVTLENGLSVSMPSLESLGQLQVNCADVTALLFPNLKSVGSLYADVASVAMVDLRQLVTCDGHFVMKAGSTTSVNNTLLASLDLSSLECVRGMLTVEKFTKVQNMALPVLETADGNISFTSLTTLGEVSMPVLRYCGGLACKSLSAAERFSMPELAGVAGDISIEGNTATAPVAAIELPKLASTGGRIYLSTAVAEAMQTLSLPALEQTGGDFDLRYMRNVTDLRIPALRRIGGKLYFYYMSGIERLDISGIADLPSMQLIGCESLKTIAAAAELNDVTFNGASVQNKSDLPQFEQPTVINGTLEFSSYRYTAETTVEIANITSAATVKAGFTGGSGAFLALSFPDLEHLDNLTVTNAYWLKSLSLPKLTEVGGKFDMEYTQYMADGGLEIPKLRKIGELVFNGASYAGAAGNFTLRTSLVDFSDVEQIGRLTVKWWGAITDFSGLKKAAASVPDGNWDISGNVLNGSTVGFNPTKEDILNGNCYAE